MAIRSMGAGVLAGLTLLTLGGCGSGGGGNEPQAAAAPPATATVLLAGRTADARLQGAVACLDLDGDGACGAAEPRSAASDAEGRFSIAAAPGAATAHALLLEVPASAIDHDSGGAVGRAFTLAAPAAAGGAAGGTLVVSALSTLVHAHMAHSGSTRDEAVALVQREAALAVSPLADFSGANGASGASGSTSADTAAPHARALSRLLLLAAQELAGQLQAEIGSTDALGNTVTAADVAREVQRSLLGQLPLANAAALALSSDTTLAAADAATRAQVWREQAQSLAEQVGAPRDNVRVAALMRRLAAPPLLLSGTTASLTAIRWTDDNNWYLRYVAASAADNVPDSQNYRRYYDVRQQSAGTGAGSDGVVQGWGWHPDPLRAGDLHWNGSAWVACSFVTQRYRSRVRDDTGRSDFDYCDNRLAGTSVRRIVDIAGQRLADVVRDRIRTFPGNGSGVAFAQWGPSDLTRYGNAVFPPGSQLWYQSNTHTSTAISYDPQAVRSAYSAAIAAGGDARSIPTLPCNGSAAALAAAFLPVGTLEELIARNPGTPCIFNQAGTPPNLSLDPNTWWGNSTAFFGDISGANTLPAGTGNYYNTLARVRVAFAPTGNRATFYRCFSRANDNSPRNCSVMGIGRWRIETLGDARLLRLTTPPGLGARLGYERIFIERGGRVYLGWKDPVGLVDNDVRLNLEAGNAVLFQLGLPPMRPVTQPGTATGAAAAALAAVQGALGDADGTTAAVFRFGPNGRFFIAEAKPVDTVLRGRSGAELGWLDWDPATGAASTVLQVDSNLTSGTSHPRSDDLPVSLAADGIRQGGTLIAGRLPTGSGQNLVGMWALDTLSDLAKPHMVFFANGRFMWVQHGFDPAADCFNSATQCTPGVEFASWQFDGAGLRIDITNMLYDTNGCAGVFNNCPAAVAAQLVNTTSTISILNFAADGSSFTIDDNGTPRTFFRVPNP